MNEIDSLNALKINTEHSKKIVRELFIFITQLDNLRDLERAGYRVDLGEKKLLLNVVNSLIMQLKIINNSLPGVIERISLFKELPAAKKAAEKKKIKKKEQLVSLKYKHPSVEDIEKEKIKKGKTQDLIIKKIDRMKFLKELSLTDSSIRRLKKEHKKAKVKKEIGEFKKPSFYAKISSKLFSKLSNRLIEKGYFSKLNTSLRTANLSFLSNTYIAMAFFTSLVSFFVSIILLIILLFFNLGIDYPFFTLTSEPIYLRFLKNFWIIFVIPLLTFVAFYFYPSTEKRSISGKINQELPFVVIHMSAIAGSGVEPTNIFRIIVTSKEYKHTNKELKKLLNQINLYGYDLVGALRNSAKITPSDKLAELFNGLATTITSGGDLSLFLDKRAESLIFDYKIEREKYTKMAETFMDIYISVVIAAPMMMTMLLVMMSLINMSFGLSMKAITLLLLLGISLLNIIFLVFLHLKQPEF